MDIKNFIEQFAEAVEVETSQSLTPETIFRDIDEWSSLAGLSVIAMADEEYGKELSSSDLRKVNTLQELYDLIVAE